MVKSRWINRLINFGVSFIMLFAFTVISVKGHEIWLYADKEYTEGTDSSCKAYWDGIENFLQSFDAVHITNKGWVPSPKIITRSNLIRNTYD